MFSAEQRGEGAARPATANGSVKGVRRGWCGPQPEARTRAPTQPTHNARRSPLERDGRGCWADREKDDARNARQIQRPGKGLASSWCDLSHPVASNHIMDGGLKCGLKALRTTKHHNIM
jgi:hypothetical protein